ncbi:hypothetical protein IPG36_01815 [bacterium]|nr:MAG: hypothetical protein IPG36_01815 [bacterium]
MNILYVCRGNAFRSLIAEAYTNSLGLPDVACRSAGTLAVEHKGFNQQSYQRTFTFLQAQGLGPFTKDHYADALTQAHINWADMVVCLNAVVCAEAKDTYSLPKSTLVWDVADMGEPGRIAVTESAKTAAVAAAFTQITRLVDDLVRSKAPSDLNPDTRSLK